MQSFGKHLIVADMFMSTHPLIRPSLMQVRGAFVPSAAKEEYGGYFSIPRSTYQLCPNYVDSNGTLIMCCSYSCYVLLILLLCVAHTLVMCCSYSYYVLLILLLCVAHVLLMC
jgi:hypothetical protein